jgi:hypothetical protein
MTAVTFYEVKKKHVILFFVVNVALLLEEAILSFLYYTSPKLAEM